jgi:hypothetical protein
MYLIIAEKACYLIDKNIKNLYITVTFDSNGLTCVETSIIPLLIMNQNSSLINTNAPRSSISNLLNVQIVK